MKVFLTGATGFVGSAVLARLIAAGHTVKGLVQDKDKADIVKKAGGIPVMGDLLVPGPWSESVKDCQIVISASSSFGINEALSLHEAERRAETHAEGVSNLLHASTMSKVEAVVLTYHVTAFGNQGDRWASEVMTIDPVGLSRPVAGAYWDIEKAAKKAGIPTIEVFPGWVYGPGSWFKMMVEALQSGILKVVGAGTNFFSLVHINDLAEGYKLILDKMPIDERFCLVDGHPVRQREMVNFAAGLMGLPAPENIEYNRFASEMGDVLAEAIDSSVRATNNKAKNELGFKPGFADYTQGFPDALKALGVKLAKVELPKAAGF